MGLSVTTVVFLYAYPTLLAQLEVGCLDCFLSHLLSSTTVNHDCMVLNTRFGVGYMNRKFGQVVGDVFVLARVGYAGQKESSSRHRTHRFDADLACSSSLHPSPNDPNNGCCLLGLSRLYSCTSHASVDISSGRSWYSERRPSVTIRALDVGVPTGVPVPREAKFTGCFTGCDTTTGQSSGTFWVPWSECGAFGVESFLWLQDYVTRSTNAVYPAICGRFLPILFLRVYNGTIFLSNARYK